MTDDSAIEQHAIRLAFPGLNAGELFFALYTQTEPSSDDLAPQLTSLYTDF